MALAFFGFLYRILILYSLWTITVDLNLNADVLVIGGGPAGCWAALTAAENGARVVLAEKGYVGTAGATAAGNTTIIHTPPDSVLRQEAIGRRVARGLGLVEPERVDAVLQETYTGLNQLSAWGYRFPNDDHGTPFFGSMRGVDYLRFMRQRLIKMGVQILDQSPALGLLQNDGVVAGAHGESRLSGEAWLVQAKAVVISTGGCAFLSGALGTNNLTGDGYLMAAEAGAALSSMEFTGQYGISPAHSSVTKGIIYFWSSFYDADHRLIETKGDRQDIVARHLVKGPVYAVIDKADPHLREGMRRGQPNIFVPFDRAGIDPFTQKFEVTLRHEGTVRGTGGLSIDALGATTVPGLYAAGDAAARDQMTGATSGGGGPNASWALATGVWSGKSAAAFAKSIGLRGSARALKAPREAVFRQPGKADAPDVIARIQEHILPLDRGFYRSASRLIESATALDGLWCDASRAVSAGVRAREATAMLATARWITASARVRYESRGIHRRIDVAASHPAWTVPVTSGGLERVWAGPDATFKEAVGQ
ncbi:succinate dehydrogenase/fumarate reductase flavoprotein subunit [Beijerinckia sp. GAS462]|nr:succinate dehydrogenase/fumarate reductase flavoprotein subunit [Beijerinckia sp. GAS462]SEC02738.1 Succinate dehydrogenase/fumarate reductase, flavoprotein subunit [Beijerinckia sp. 28-YEA-48]